jgi:hypothetical protein
MVDATGDRHTQVFTCPRCSGPLRIMGDGRFGCEVGHRYDMGGAVQEDTQKVTGALMRAVSSLRNRAAMARWAARNPGMYGQSNADAQHASALEDDDMADVLLRHAQTLDPSAGDAAW